MAKNVSIPAPAAAIDEGARAARARYWATRKAKKFVLAVWLDKSLQDSGANEGLGKSVRALIESLDNARNVSASKAALADYVKAHADGVKAATAARSAPELTAQALRDAHRRKPL